MPADLLDSGHSTAGRQILPFRSRALYLVQAYKHTVSQPAKAESPEWVSMAASIQVPAESRFWRWLKATTPYPTTLAWCHTTDAFSLRDIIAAGFLSPKPCPVFREDLMYFFYGRPAYRTDATNQLRTRAVQPVVLVLRPDLQQQGKRLFPFDTGAFASKRYAAWMHAGMSMSDFELECPSDAPRRHVASFFGNNANYLRLKAQPPTVPYAGEFEVDALVTMLTDPNITNADDRRIAVELQFSCPVAMTAEHIQALIVPLELQQAGFMSSFLSGAGAGIEVCSYEPSQWKVAGEYQALLEERARDLQEKWGLA